MIKKGLEPLIHIIFWACTAGLIASSFSIVSHQIEVNNGVENVQIIRNTGMIYQLLLCVGLSVLAFYANVRFISCLSENKTKALWYSGFIFLTLLVAAYTLSIYPFFRPSPPIPTQMALGVVSFYYALSLAFALAKLWLSNQRRHNQLLLDKNQAELSLLRNQLQPHFLFNALNNLLSMVKPSENPKLVDSFERLSQLLRYVIEGNNNEKVILEKEISFLKNYIALQMLRFGEDEVLVDLKIEGPYTKQKIEPGLFIVFVENAFKYGTEPEKNARINIAFDVRNPNRIDFSIGNSVLMPQAHGSGTGLASVRKRLALIYPTKHSLSIKNHREFTVHLSIQST